MIYVIGPGHGGPGLVAHSYQEDFAARCHIPIGALRDWEQGRATPDQAARAYLTVIARDPEGVRRALVSRHRRST